MLAAYSILLAPWGVFAPMDAEAYEDPDVTDALPGMYAVGVGWILSCLAVIGSVIYTGPKDPTSVTDEPLDGEN